MNIIIAPHPDDELIGAYSLIKKGLIHSVVYLDVTPERWRLAKNAGKGLGFHTTSMDFRDLYNYLEANHNTLTTFLVPDVLDNHVLHKAVNCIARLSKCRLGYYTTDMNTGYTKELSKSDQQEKRAMLDKFYPDQRSLWESNWKYFLFEGTVLDFKE